MFWRARWAREPCAGFARVRLARGRCARCEPNRAEPQGLPTLGSAGAVHQRHPTRPCRCNIIMFLHCATYIFFYVRADNGRLKN